MGIRNIAREARLVAALENLAGARSRSKEFPSTTTERQRWDRRRQRLDSTQPQAVLATVKALSEGKGTRGAAAANDGAGYYGGGGGGGGGGFGGGFNQERR